MNGGPSELASQLGRINCIAPIMTGAITHPIDEVAGLAHCLKNRLQDLKITPLTIGANQISLPQLTLIQNGPYSTGMVINVNPITNIFAVTIQSWAPTASNTLDRCRDELLFVLQQTIVVAAIRNSRRQAICTSPGAYEQVGASLGCRIGRTWSIRRILRETRGIFQGKIAKNLVRAYMMEANAVRASNFEQTIRTFNVRFYERGRITSSRPTVNDSVRSTSIHLHLPCASVGASAKTTPNKSSYT